MGRHPCCSLWGFLILGTGQGDAISKLAEKTEAWKMELDRGLFRAVSNIFLLSLSQQQHLVLFFSSVSLISTINKHAGDMFCDDGTW